MRRFEYVEGTSAKFWMADVEGDTFVVIFGRLGTSGQRKEKAFPTEGAAQKELEKKIAEKLREGYSEVGASGAPAEAPTPSGAKGAAAAPALLELPPRGREGDASPERVQAAALALASLRDAVGRRSFLLGRKARLARRALGAIRGFDPSQDAALGQALDGVMARVTAASSEKRLSLVHAIELLYELDAAAYVRALEAWTKAPAQGPAAKAIAVLGKQLEELSDPELGLRVGALLVDRPDRGSMSNEAGWKLRWKALSPHLEAHLAQRGATLKAWVKGLDAAGDAQIARRIARM